MLVSPLLLVVALYLRRTEGSPVIYRQTRIGLNGRPFSVLKFRTMIRDAEQQVDQLALFNEVRGRAFKMTNDPRLTRSGAFLRRTSLDELPQLWNVLRGEMSLVGPRPPLPEEVAGYDVWHRRRLSMKPGITGPVAGQRAQQPGFRSVGRARPRVHRPLVAVARHEDHGADGAGTRAPNRAAEPE